MPNQPPPLARIETKRWWGYKCISSFSLDYSVFQYPQIIVNDDGKHFEFLSTGYERNLNAINLGIFRADGSRICLLGSNDLFPKNVGVFPKWNGQPNYSIYHNDSNDTIGIKLTASAKPGTQSKDKCPDILVRIESGEVLTQKSDLAPWLYSYFGFTIGPSNETISPCIPSEYLCNQAPPIGDFSQAELIPSDIFFSLLNEHPLPSYPPIAAIAKIAGTSVLEFFVSPDGNIQCVEYLSGPPQLAHVLKVSTLKWSFNVPITPDGQKKPFRGRISITGGVMFYECKNK